MSSYNIYRAPAIKGYGSGYSLPPGYGRVPTDAAPTYGQYQPSQAPLQPPRQSGITNGNLTYNQPNYGSFSGVNDATLAAGASYSIGGGGNGSLPPGAIPYDPFAGGNANIMYARGYRKKLVNGQWAWLPPAAPGAQAPATYFPT